MQPIRCRVKRSYWWAVIGYLGMGTGLILLLIKLPPNPPTASPWPNYLFFGSLAVLFLAIAVFMLLALLRVEVIVNEAGLRWREIIGDWKNVPWNEISDFYLQGKKHCFGPIQTSPALILPTVETPQGQLKLDRSLNHLDEALPIIAARAVNAPVREWEIWEFRADQNFVQRFDYWTKSQKWTFPGIVTALVALGIPATKDYLSSPKSTAAIFRFDPSDPSFWAIVSPAILFFGPFLVAMGKLWSDRRAAYNHRNEHLEIYPTGLAWQKDDDRIEALWNEVRSITLVHKRELPAHYMVKAENGDFRVWTSLDEIQKWHRFVQYFAPQLELESPLAAPDLGDEASTWSGEKIGEGARVFHFRTRNTRTVLWGVTVFLLVPPLISYWFHAMPTPEEGIEPFHWSNWAIWILIGSLCVSYLWRCFYHAAIQADDEGLELRLPSQKPRVVSWSEISTYGYDDWEYYLTVDAKKWRPFRISSPTRRQELLQLIKERATNATGTWNRP